MPVIKWQDTTSEQVLAKGLEERNLVHSPHGSQSLRVGELTVAPNSRVPRHIHANTEEAMIVLEGTLDAILGKERTTVVAGQTVLAPAGAVHGFVNRYDEPARVLFVFPTNEIEFTLASGPRDTVGFTSEKGLSAYQSSGDRPLDKG